MEFSLEEQQASSGANTLSVLFLEKMTCVKVAGRVLNVGFVPLTIYHVFFSLPLSVVEEEVL